MDVKLLLFISSTIFNLQMEPSSWLLKMLVLQTNLVASPTRVGRFYKQTYLFNDGPLNGELNFCRSSRLVYVSSQPNRNFSISLFICIGRLYSAKYPRVYRISKSPNMAPNIRQTVPQQMMAALVACTHVSGFTSRCGYVELSIFLLLFPERVGSEMFKGVFSFYFLAS